MTTLKPRSWILSVCAVAFLLFGGLLLFADLGFTDSQQNRLLLLLNLSFIAAFSATGLVRKLSTQTYEDGGGVHHRDSDPVTYWYLVAFNMLGILAFIGIAILTAMDFA